MSTKQTFEIIAVVAQRLDSVSKNIHRSKDWIVNDSLIRELKMEGVPISEEMAWGPAKKKTKEQT